MTSLHSTLLLSASLLWLSGCSGESGGYDGPVGSVHGKVTVNGKPAPEGTAIQFSSDKGFSNAAKLDAEGTYQIEDLPTGTYKIYLTAPAEEVSDDAAVETKSPKTPFPKQYLQADTSGETFEVKEGNSNEYNLEIK